MKSKEKILKIIFFVSFIPILLVTVFSIYYSIVGRVHYSWIEPYETYTAYGLEEFCNSFFYYGGYLTLVVPLFEVCFFYQIFYIIYKIKLKRIVSK